MIIKIVDYLSKVIPWNFVRSLWRKRLVADSNHPLLKERAAWRGIAPCTSNSVIHRPKKCMQARCAVILFADGNRRILHELIQLPVPSVLALDLHFETIKLKKSHGTMTQKYSEIAMSNDWNSYPIILAVWVVKGVLWLERKTPQCP